MLKSFVRDTSGEVLIAHWTGFTIILYGLDAGLTEADTTATHKIGVLEDTQSTAVSLEVFGGVPLQRHMQSNPP